MLKAEKGNVCPLKADFTELILPTKNVFIIVYLSYFLNFSLIHWVPTIC